MPLGQGPGGGSDDDEDGGPRMRRAREREQARCSEQNAGPPVPGEQSVMAFPVVAAAYYGGLPAVGAALRQGGDIDELDPKENWRPLHAATFTEQDDVVEYLIKMRATVDLAGPSGMTPLHLAARDNSFVVADLLLRARADAALTDQDGRTAHAIAAANGSAKVTAFLDAFASGSLEDLRAVREATSAVEPDIAPQSEQQAPAMPPQPVRSCISSMPVAMVHGHAAVNEEEHEAVTAIAVEQGSVVAEPAAKSGAGSSIWFGSAVDPDNPDNKPADLTMDDLERIANS